MYKILINTKTIRKSATYTPYGIRQYLPGPVEITIDGKTATEDELQMVLTGKIDCDINIHRDMIDCTCISNPEFLYEYKKKKVRCEMCEEKFDHSELESDYGSDGEWEFSIENICPKCGIGNCCDIKYETIEECFERTGIDPETIKKEN